MKRRSFLTCFEEVQHVRVPTAHPQLSSGDTPDSGIGSSGIWVCHCSSGEPPRRNGLRRSQARGRLAGSVRGAERAITCERRGRTAVRAFPWPLFRLCPFGRVGQPSGERPPEPAKPHGSHARHRSPVAELLLVHGPSSFAGAGPTRSQSDPVVQLARLDPSGLAAELRCGSRPSLARLPPWIPDDSGPLPRQ